MGKVFIEESSLTAIGNAIRAKTGDTALLGVPEGMVAAIEGIPTSDLADELINRTITKYESDITEINSGTFCYCQQLTDVNCPNVTEIKDYSFYNCDKLENISFPNVVTTGSYSFSYCRNLESISFPNVTSVGPYCFEYCTNLINVNLPSLTTIRSSGLFMRCDKITSLILPNLTTVSNYSLYYMTDVLEIILPKITKIQNYTFNYDYSLVKLVIGTDLTTVIPLTNTNAFTSCYHLLGTTNSSYNPTGAKDCYIYVPASLVADYRTATN